MKKSDFYKCILSSMDSRICVLDCNLEVHWSNEDIIQGSNKTDLRLSTKRCHQYLISQETSCYNCLVLRVFETNKDQSVDLEMEIEGRPKYVRLSAKPLRTTPDSKFSYVVETARDITEQKESEITLRKLNAFNRAVIDNAPVAIFTLDKEGRFTSLNNTVARMTGLGDKAWEKMIGWNYCENKYARESGLANYFWTALNGEAVTLTEFPLIMWKKEGKVIHDIKAVPLRGNDGTIEGIVCIADDATERVRVRTQMIREGKMSAIGRLMMSIAHELNNPLAIIVAHADLISDFAPRSGTLTLRGEKLRTFLNRLDIIREQVYRCKQTIKELNELTKKSDLIIGKVNLQTLFDDLLRLVNRTKYKVITQVSPDLPFAKGDSNALRQVFLNLITNAMEATEGMTKPSLWIRASTVGKNNLRVEIQDNGIGIAKENMEQMFEPFVTTKGSKGGTGLGLTLAYELLDRMGGNIEVESKKKQGTLFIVTLPTFVDHQKTGDKR